VISRPRAAQEKSALVEAMEEEADALMAGRAEAAAERGEADDADDQAVAGAAVSAALGALAGGAALPGAPRSSESCALTQGGVVAASACAAALHDG